MLFLLYFIVFPTNVFFYVPVKSVLSDVNVTHISWMQVYLVALYIIREQLCNNEM